MVAIRRAIASRRSAELPGGRSETPGSAHLQGSGFDLKFCIRFRELFEQTTAAPGCSIEYAIRVGPTNASSGTRTEYLQQHGAAGCYEQQHVYASFATCFTQFSHFIYSSPRESATTADSAPLATSLTSQQSLVCLEDLKPLALLLDVCRENLWNSLHSSKRRERLNYVSRNKPEYKRIILAFCHRLRGD